MALCYGHNSVSGMGFKPSTKGSLLRFRSAGLRPNTLLNRKVGRGRGLALLGLSDPFSNLVLQLLACYCQFNKDFPKDIASKLQIRSRKRTHSERIGQQWTLSPEHVFGNGFIRPVLDSSSGARNTNGVYNPGWSRVSCQSVCEHRSADRMEI